MLTVQLDVYMQDEARAACEANNAAFAAAGGNMSRVRVIKDPEEVERVSLAAPLHRTRSLESRLTRPWVISSAMHLSAMT